MPFINQAGSGGNVRISGVSISGTAVSGDVPVASSATVGTWAFPPGHELDYAQITSGTITITATADGNAGGTAVIDGNAVTYDGATRVCIEFYAFIAAMTPASAGHSVYANLYDGTTDLGRIYRLQGDVAAVTQIASAFARVFITPTAAAHTYHIRGWKDAVGDTAQYLCGAGGASTSVPAYMRITVA